MRVTEEGQEVAGRIRDVIDSCQNDYPDFLLYEMIGVLEALKLELFIEQRE